jgi:hypothetical protein
MFLLNVDISLPNPTAPKPKTTPLKCKKNCRKVEVREMNTGSTLICSTLRPACSNNSKVEKEKSNNFRVKNNW